MDYNYTNKYSMYALAEACEEDFNLLAKRNQWFYNWLYTGNNWKIIGRLETAAMRLKNVGFQHYSMSTLTGVTRYETDIAEAGYEEGKTFKLNNDMCSFAARMVMRGTPELKGFFRTRTQVYDITDVEE